LKNRLDRKQNDGYEKKEKRKKNQRKNDCNDIGFMDKTMINREK